MLSSANSISGFVSLSSSLLSSAAPSRSVSRSLSLRAVLSMTVQYTANRGTDKLVMMYLKVSLRDAVVLAARHAEVF